MTDRPSIYDRMRAATEPMRGTYAGAMADRIAGLDPVLAEAAGASVLDIGCNAGYVSAAFVAAGASSVRGLDFYEPGLAECRARAAGWPGVTAAFDRCDLAAGAPAFDAALEGWPARFDIVLYLGVHHHLARQIDDAALAGLTDAIVARCGRLLAMRAPEAAVDTLDRALRDRGLARQALGRPSEAAGFLGIYRRAG